MPDESEDLRPGDLCDYPVDKLQSGDCRQIDDLQYGYGLSKLADEAEA